MEILDSEKRRARNQVWTAAQEYGFEPELKVYDAEGRADLYWNSISGCVRRNYDMKELARFFSTFRGSLDQQLYEQLVWLGLESAVFEREQSCRPALPALRRENARRTLEQFEEQPTDQPVPILIAGRCREILNLPTELTARESELLSSLRFSGAWSTEEVTTHAADVLSQYFEYVPLTLENGEKNHDTNQKKKRIRLVLKRQAGAVAELPHVRGFGFGYGEHIQSTGGKETGRSSLFRLPRITAQDPEKLRTYVADYFGPSLFDRPKADAIERELCTDAHSACHIYFTRGSNEMDPAVRGYAGGRRREALKQMKKNKAFYEENIIRNRAAVARLTARIQNAMLAHLQPTVARASAGELDIPRVWRAEAVHDEKVFTRVLRGDPGELSVDILLDASTSQVQRQATLSTQGYLIAESLNQCHIPVRVCSFCSLSGYTILNLLRDYDQRNQNDKIFHYFTTGCNRDGLGLRAANYLLQQSPCEHRLLILLSDAKPNDVEKLPAGKGKWRDYADDAGVEDTAREVRAISRTGTSVICVFTGENEDLPAARTIYGRNFTRIRSLDQFADTVGSLIQTQIRNM